MPPAAAGLRWRAGLPLRGDAMWLNPRRSGLGMPRSVDRCLTAGLVAVAALNATIAQAQSIPAGTFEVTIAAGGGGSLPKDDLHLETVTTFHLLPHVGYFLTNEVGDRGPTWELRDPRRAHPHLFGCIQVGHRGRRGDSAALGVRRIPAR